jgi:hypothetical protein
MNDHPLVQALHAAISRRDWHAVEQAADRIRDDRRIQWPEAQRCKPGCSVTNGKR